MMSVHSRQNLTGAQLAAQLSSSALLGCKCYSKTGQQIARGHYIATFNTFVLQSVNTLVLQFWKLDKNKTLPWYGKGEDKKKGG